MHTHRPCLWCPPLHPSFRHSITTTHPITLHISTPHSHPLPPPYPSSPYQSAPCPSPPHLNFHSSPFVPPLPHPSSASYLQPLIPPPLHPLTYSPFILHRATGMTPEELVDLRYVWPWQLCRGAGGSPLCLAMACRAEEDLAGSTAPQIWLLLRYEMIATKVMSWCGVPKCLDSFPSVILCKCPGIKKCTLR